MKLGAYSVKDMAVNAYMPPFYCRTDAEAVRSFESTCLDAKHPFAMHPRDYHLYRVGTFDDASGEFETYHTHLAAASSFALLELAPLEQKAAS